ncbi:MAG: DUF6184 family natural product biosynthesis lipoprotein [Polyangiaceae bacterium]|jgi:hypothetical protein
MKTTLAVLLVLVPALSAACDHDSNPPASAPLTTSGVVAAQPVSDHDVEVISKERCDREDRCSNIGVNRKYATREVCVEQTRADNLNALTNAACPYGIDPARLQMCLSSIRDEHCNNPFDTLSRYTACTKTTLCPR